MTVKRILSHLLCTLIIASAFVYTANAQKTYSDVKYGDWYYQSVYDMTNKGYMKGTSDTAFSPKAPMTRGMFVTVIAAIANAETDNEKTGDFYDVARGKYYTSAVVWATENGIISGTSKNYFSPDSYITREQCAVILRSFGLWLNYDVTYEDETLLSLCYDNACVGKYALEAVRWALNYGLMSNRGDMDFCPKSSLTRAECAVILSNFLKYEEIPPIVPPKTHTVRFVNHDNSLLYSCIVEDGKSAKYRGVAPTKTADYYYTYTFGGWSAPFDKVTTNLTVKAQFTATQIYHEPPKPQEIDIRNDKFGPGITVNNSTFQMSPSLCARLNSALAGSNGRTVGFYVVDLQSKMTLGYNATTEFWTACTVKAGMALYAYKKCEWGAASLSDIWTYQKRHYCDRSGTIQYSAFGTRYTAEYVLYNMIHISDNAAYYMAQDYLGYQGYNAYIKSLGVKHTHWSYNSWGYLTPQELGLIWQEIYNYRTQSWYGAKLFDIFLNAKYNFIKQGLYNRYDVAHKSGWNDKSYNDAGVVFGKRPYVMVIMTTPGNLNGNEAYLGSIARLLNEYMDEYSAWIVNQ